MKALFGVVFTVLILASQSQAQYANYSDYFDEIAEIANQVQMTQDTSYKLAGTPVNDSCTVFMSKENFLGDTGKSIYQTIKKNKASFPLLMQGGTLNRYCSKYASMKDDEKAMVLVMLLTMMAHFESSCNIKAKARGPDGTAKGLYQLHAGHEQNYGVDSEMCAKNASNSGALSSKCTLAMLERQLSKENGQIFSPKSYWDVLRPRGRARKADDIQRTIKRSSLCNPVTL